MTRGEVADQELENVIGHVLTEKEAQMEGALVILKPLAVVCDVAVFALCFWLYDLGLLLSIGAAVLTHIVLLFGIALPVGYVLGQRAAKQRGGTD